MEKYIPETIPDTIENDECLSVVKTLKDGTKQLECIISNCKVSTFKLRRHLVNMHPLLSEEQVKYALHMSRTFANNKSSVGPATDSKLPIAEDKPKVNRFTNTKLVNVKSNFKKCLLCHKLYRNISDHIIKTHKISKEDDSYKNLILNSNTIPRILTKCIDGVTVELEGEELASAKSTNGENLSSQIKTLNTLKHLRSEIEKIEDSIKKETESANQLEMRAQLEKLKQEYKAERYRDNTNYTENVLKWRVSFLKYLEQEKHAEPRRAVTMAFSIFHSYETDENLILNFQHLLNAQLVRDILLKYCNSSATNSSTQTKYIKLFRYLVDFLTNHFDSPERNENSTYEEILRKKLRYKEVSKEIESCLIRLKKNAGEM